MSDEFNIHATDAELLAIVRANRAETERIRSQPYPIGLWVIVTGRIDADGPLTMHAAGQVTAYYPYVGDGELWIRDAWGDIERVRLHGHDDDPISDTVGPATFYESWTAYEIALKQQFKVERAQYEQSAKRKQRGLMP